MSLFFWRKKTRNVPSQGYKDLSRSNSNATVTLARVEKATTIRAVPEQRKSKGTFAGTHSEQPFQFPTEKNAIPYPWSTHPLVLEPPETIPKPGVIPSTAPSPTPFPRYGHSLSPTANEDGDLILFGGLVDDSPHNDIYTISIRDGTTRLIETSGEIPTPRFGHSSVLSRNMLFVWGGDTRQICDAYKTTSLDNSLYFLDLVSHEWIRYQVQGVLPEGRYGHTMAVVDNAIYIFGGQHDGVFMNDVWVFDTASLDTFPRRLNTSFHELSGSMKDPTWELIRPSIGSSEPANRTNHIWIPLEQHIILFGGTDSQYHYNDVWSLNVTSRIWTELPSIGYIPAPREGHAAAMIDGIVYIFGGRGVDGKHLGDLGAFRVSHSRWYMFQKMGPTPSARSGHAMAAVNGQAFVLGGLSSEETASEDGAVVHVLETSNIKYPPLAGPVPLSPRTDAVAL